MQRYIGRRSRGTKLHGFILSYWHRDGNNLDFVHLLHLVDLAERYRDVDPLNESLSQEAEEYFEPLQRFVKSFRKDAKDLWDSISGPYRNIDDLGDFVADDDDDEVADGVSARLMHREMELQAQEEELDDDAEQVSRYQELYQAAVDEDDESSRDETSASENGGEECGESDEDADLHDSDDESEDSWIKERRKKMEKTIRKRQSKEFRRTSRTSRASLSPETMKPKGASLSNSSKKRNLLTIEDSSDDDDY